MPRYELKKDCLFVDAYDLDEAKKNPLNPPDRSKQEIKHAHVMDKGPGISSSSTSRSPVCPYIELNDVAGFIGRFIVMGVDTDSILPQIIASDYGISVDRCQKRGRRCLRLDEELSTAPTNRKTI